MNDQNPLPETIKGAVLSFLQQADSFAGLKLFPTFFTDKVTAKYPVFTKESFVQIPHLHPRAASAGHARSYCEFGSNAFTCREYSHEEPVDEKQIAAYRSSFDAVKVSTIRSAAILLVNHELRVKAKATGSNVPKASPTSKWDNYATSNPLLDIKTARKAIWKACGQATNRMVIGYDVFEALIDHPQISTRLNFSQKGVKAKDLLAALFMVEELIVAGPLDDLATEGEISNPAAVWGDSVVLAHVSKSPGLEVPSFGRTFTWTGGKTVKNKKAENTSGVSEGDSDDPTNEPNDEPEPEELEIPMEMMVREYSERNTDSIVPNVKHFVDEVLVLPVCGFHLEDVLS